MACVSSGVRCDNRGGGVSQVFPRYFSGVTQVRLRGVQGAEVWTLSLDNDNFSQIEGRGVRC